MNIINTTQPITRLRISLSKYHQYLCARGRHKPHTITLLSIPCGHHFCLYPEWVLSKDMGNVSTEPSAKLTLPVLIFKNCAMRSRVLDQMVDSLLHLEWVLQQVVLWEFLSMLGILLGITHYTNTPPLAS